MCVHCVLMSACFCWQDMVLNAARELDDGELEYTCQHEGKEAALE